MHANLLEAEVVMSEDSEWVPEYENALRSVIVATRWLSGICIAESSCLVYALNSVNRLGYVRLMLARITVCIGDVLSAPQAKYEGEA